MSRLFAAVLVTLTLSGLAEAQEKWALLVGINEYRVDRWKLKGCVNDVLMTKELLINKFGFPEANVKTLLDEEATADNIRQGIEEWLIAKSKPEDIVYFHFSGHGAQIPDTDGDEEDGMDEFLCAVDLNPGNKKTLVTDDQLKELFERIPSKNVTIITDCCHSGTGTRDISLNRSRAIDSWELENFALVEQADGSTRAVVMTPPAGSSRPPQAPPPPPPAAEPPPPPAEVQTAPQVSIETGNKLQVHISGSHDDQTSADAWIRQGMYAGALTYYWIENLKKAPADLTYRQLIERVRRDLKARKYTQIPQVNGAADRPVFGTKIAAATVPFVVITAARGSSGTLGVGRLQNVTEGSVYAVFPPGETDFVGEGLGRIRVSRVQATTAQVTAVAGLTLQTGYRAKKLLHNQTIEKLKLLVEGGNAATQGAVKTALGQYPFVEAVESGKHFHQRLQLTNTPTGIQASLTIDGVPGPAVGATDATALVEELNSQLESSYAINFLSTLSNDNPPFNVQVWANKASGGGTRDLTVEELDEAEDEKYMQARLGDVLRFHFIADEDCYLTMINVGTSGKVTVLFPNRLYPDGFVKGGVEYRTRWFKGDPEAQIPLTIKLNPKSKTGREFVQVIASKTRLNFGALKKKTGSQFVAAITSELAVNGGGGNQNLLPTDQWATDYMYIETYR